MARERTPEGKRIVIPVRVSEPKAAEIDKARGETPRSVWVERAIDTALALIIAKHRQPSAAPRRAHALTCKCGTCRPKNGDKS